MKPFGAKHLKGRSFVLQRWELGDTTVDASGSPVELRSKIIPRRTIDQHRLMDDFHAMNNQTIDSFLVAVLQQE